MRGRTLDDAFVILDEAQNTTHAQMKMFLTRLGFGSKWLSLVTNSNRFTKRGKSGLKEAVKLSGVSGISIMKMDQSDVVRHPPVKLLIVMKELNKCLL